MTGWPDLAACGAAASPSAEKICDRTVTAPRSLSYTMDEIIRKQDMSGEFDDLYRLAALYGLEASYRDVFGRYVTSPPEAVRETKAMPHLHHRCQRREAF